MIQAANLGQNPQPKSATFIITVSDENDNSPIFNPASYRPTVKENAAVGKSVTKVIIY